MCMCMCVHAGTHVYARTRAHTRARTHKFSPVNKKIKAVKEVITVPLLVGGGIKTETQKKEVFDAGADMVVMGTVFE